MKIGIDFDNTIVDYTDVFYEVAVELGWLSTATGKSKTQVKQYFINANEEKKWTELQGIVYGREIGRSKPYMDCVKILKKLKLAGHDLVIISHKTAYPVLNHTELEVTNLQDAAKNWLHENNIVGPAGFVELTKIFFNETKSMKIQCIVEQQCDLFIDDLEDIFSNIQFPKSTNKILFDPRFISLGNFDGFIINNWNQLPTILDCNGK